MASQANEQESYSAEARYEHVCGSACGVGVVQRASILIGLLSCVSGRLVVHHCQYCIGTASIDNKRLPSCLEMFLGSIWQRSAA
jgi:hypothetical protein